MSELNLNQRQAASMTNDQLDCARRLYEESVPDGDLQALIDGNTAEGAYYLRCGVLGQEPPDGE